MPNLQANSQAVLKQVDVGRLDFDALAAEIGAPTKGAAQKRWQRFQAKLKSGAAPAAAGTPDKPAGVKKNTGTTKSASKKAPAAKGKEGVDGDDGEPTTPTPKKKAAPRKPKAKVVKSEEVVKEQDEEMLLGGPAQAEVDEPEVLKVTEDDAEEKQS